MTAVRNAFFSTQDTLGLQSHYPILSYNEIFVSCVSVEGPSPDCRNALTEHVFPATSQGSFIAQSSLRFFEMRFHLRSRREKNFPPTSFKQLPVPLHRRYIEDEIVDKHVALYFRGHCAAVSNFLTAVCEDLFTRTNLKLLTLDSVKCVSNHL